MLFITGLLAASQINTCSTRAPSVARLFTYESLGNGAMKVNSTQCTNAVYVLYPRGQARPTVSGMRLKHNPCFQPLSSHTFNPFQLIGHVDKYFEVPLRKVAVTQTVSNTFLETIGARDKMIVASEYTTSACIAQRVANGGAQAYVSNSADAAAHAALMANSEIDAIFSDPYYGGSRWAHPPSAPKVICEAPTYET